MDLDLKLDYLFDQLDNEQDHEKRKRLMKRILEIDKDNYMIRYYLISESKEYPKQIIKRLQIFLKETREYLENKKLWNENNDSLYFIYDRAGRAYIYGLRQLAEQYTFDLQLDKAKFYFEEVLRLNPNDNLGARWDLMCIYYNDEEINKLNNLIKKYPDDLLANVFKLIISKNYDKKLFEQIIKRNFFILHVIVGTLISDCFPTVGMYRPGSFDEAINYLDTICKHTFKNRYVKMIDSILPYFEGFKMEDYISNDEYEILIWILRLSGINKYKSITKKQFLRFINGDESLAKKYKNDGMFNANNNKYNDEKINDLLNTLERKYLIEKYNDEFTLSFGGQSLLFTSMKNFEDSEDNTSSDDYNHNLN